MQFSPLVLVLVIATSLFAVGVPGTDCVAQTQRPPAVTPYTVLRWDEDYSHLKGTSRDGDLFDPLKYIPLGTDGYL